MLVCALLLVSSVSSATSSATSLSMATPPTGGPPPGQFWDQRYKSEDYAYGTAPNDFLKEACGSLPPKSKILCLAEGEGRNAVYLASLGHSVHGVDASAVGLAKAETLAEKQGVKDKVTTQTVDLNDYDMGTSEWDAIVAIFCHLPPPLREKVHAAIPAALKPGGKLFLEAYNPQQLEFKTGGPPALEMLFTPEMMKEDFEGLKLEKNEMLVRDVTEGTFHTGKGAVIQVVGLKG
mmetsp:Transcript_9433/g.22016  ORF Transcript_9433/g.22016 Transcript_9433/m.22016 type:complete len:235 (+) Transcript_9433:44-748(+)